MNHTCGYGYGSEWCKNEATWRVKGKPDRGFCAGHAPEARAAGLELEPILEAQERAVQRATEALGEAGRDLEAGLKAR